MRETDACHRRRAQIQAMLSRDPFLSDKSLASHFGVSLQTVRLDRMALGIPDQRARTKKLAEMVYGRVKSLPPREIIGELLDVELGKSAISVMEATPEMALERSGIIRSHYIFAQADSLAFSVMDAGNVVTGIANLKFKRPVHIGEKLIAKAQVIRTKGNKSVVLVETRSRGDLVFRAKFLMFALDSSEHPNTDAGVGVPERVAAGKEEVTQSKGVGPDGKEGNDAGGISGD